MCPARTPSARTGNARPGSPSRNSRPGPRWSSCSARSTRSAGGKERMADKSGGRKWWEREEKPAPAAPSMALREEDVYLFREGTHYRVYERMGAHPDTVDGAAGTRFAVWA